MLKSKKDPAGEPLKRGDHLSDRYYIIERIAAGGHSIVYRGEDERLSRPVCVKVFHRLNSRDGVYQTAYDHFVQEAFALSKLTHPNTLRIFDFGYLAVDAGDGKGAPFQVSEYMNDGTLSTLIKRQGPMPRIDAIKVIESIGGALSEAHECGIIHRDIKPQNILFSKVGRGWVTKLADFGIAKSLGASDAMLQNQAEDTAIVAGRPLLMYSLRWAAPEQLRGLPVIRASDIYSLALSIIYMLTGNAVFVSRVKNEAKEQRKRSDDFIAAACAKHGVPSRALAVLQAACAFEAQKRPQDVDEFTGELVEALRRQRAASPNLQALPTEVQQTTEFIRHAQTPRRLHPASGGQVVCDRRGVFVGAADDKVDVSCCNGSVRLRLSFVPSANGFCVHLKGLNCFVSQARGRPSGAVQFESDGRCDLMLPDLKPLASIAVSFGTPAAGHQVFDVGTDSVAIATDDCPQIVALDFGAGGDCLFVYTGRMPGA